MGDLAGDRVYDERAGVQFVFAGTEMGVATVETSGDSIGRFRLARECEARDLAGAGGWLAVATPEDVLAASVGEEGACEWVETGFGPAVAVGVDEGDLLAAGPDGELGRVVDVGADPTDWLAVADVDGTVRAVDGPLVGASDGVYRFTVDGIVEVGLDDVRDVSAGGVPLAATGDGLFRLGNGWLRELDGPVDVVAGTDRAAGDGSQSDDPLARAHAAAGETFYAYHGDGSETSHDGRADGDADPATPDGEIVDPAVAARAWRERETPAGAVVAVAYGERTYALTADGALLLDCGDEWGVQALGLPDPTGLATPE
jgi:hypothetical protein